VTKMGKVVDNDNEDMVQIVSQDERRRILRLLLEKKLNISDLSKATHLDRATVSYHLGILEGAGIVFSGYEMLKPPNSMGKVGRYYTVNQEKLVKALKPLDELMKSLRVPQKVP